ncbi:hypothetical protein [Streptomyces sp. NPDC058291]|jgi:magnesium-transporting ATPase (P-type)|uniref:hypothetical protein n=1 Tax=Streptomyces sp. NPDC058291 TaxID=3346427 RepID=UPI0036E894E2
MPPGGGRPIDGQGLREAGVRPVVLTRGHPQTARAIAADRGRPDDSSVITGRRWR